MVSEMQTGTELFQRLSTLALYQTFRMKIWKQYWYSRPRKHGSTALVQDLDINIYEESSSFESDELVQLAGAQFGKEDFPASFQKDQQKRKSWRTHPII